MLPEPPQRPAYPRRTQSILLAGSMIMALTAAAFLGAWWLVVGELFLLAACVHEFFQTKPRTRNALLGLHVGVQLLLCLLLTVLAVVAAIQIGELLRAHELQTGSAAQAACLGLGVALVLGTLAYHVLLPRIRRAS